MGARAFTYRYLVHSGPGGGPFCPLKLEATALSKKHLGFLLTSNLEFLIFVRTPYTC